jgi:putative transposase
VGTVLLQRLEVLLAIEVVARRVQVLGGDAAAGGEWVAQQARNLVMGIGKDVGRSRFVLRDRDAKLTAAFDAGVAAEGIGVLVTPVRAPRANAYAGRWGMVRRAGLDRLLIVGCRQLQSVLAEDADQTTCTVRTVPWGRCRHSGLGEAAVVVSAGRSCGGIDWVG